IPGKKRIDRRKIFPLRQRGQSWWKIPRAVEVVPVVTVGILDRQRGYGYWQTFASERRVTHACPRRTRSNFLCLCSARRRNDKVEFGRVKYRPLQASPDYAISARAGAEAK